MKLAEAKELLDGTVRTELRDHAFGDAEVSWHKDEVEVASGYFNGTVQEVIILDGPQTFNSDEAKELRSHGVLGDIERNDETGPVHYEEGKMMPGLTSEFVKHELQD